MSGHLDGMNQLICSKRRCAKVTALVGSFLLSGCATDPNPSIGDAPGRQSAYFAEFPEQLYTTIAANCQSDADQLFRPSHKALICETLPSPDTAAALILQFDGEISEIPIFVTTLNAEQSGSGYAITTQYFYIVPQKNDEVAVVRIAEPRTERVVRRAFELAGGVPITQ